MRSSLVCLMACLFVLSVLSGCSWIVSSTAVQGSGVVKTESRQVADFASVSLGAVGRVTVRQTGKESLTISAEDNILPLLESRVAGRTLFIETAKHTDIRPTKPIEFTVEVKSLEGLSLRGVGSIEAEGVQGKELLVSLVGAGEVTATGSADSLKLILTGVGSFHGEEFKTKQAMVQNAGAGSAVVRVSDDLDVTLSGVGSVEYIGSPKVRKSVSGVGSVKKR
jgi:hypothetical protein